MAHLNRKSRNALSLSKFVHLRSRMSHCRSSTGKQFHSHGPATVNSCHPAVSLSKGQPRKTNNTKHSRPKLTWFSRFLRHSARKRGRLILQHPWAHRGLQWHQNIRTNTGTHNKIWSKLKTDSKQWILTVLWRVSSSKAVAVNPPVLALSAVIFLYISVCHQTT